MSEAEIDSIIKKYDRTLYKSRHEMPATQRKKDSRDAHAITFMDNNYTPSKDNREIYEPGPGFDLLKRLDQCEAKLAVSQRNYADVSRKYDKLKQAYDTQSIELQRQRKGRLQQLIDIQNKLHLLQTDNQRNQTKLQSKQNTIAVLKQKLIQKQQEISIYERQLQNVSRKVFETLQLKNTMSSRWQVGEEEASRMLDGMRSKYEKIINNLNGEIGNFNRDLMEKQKEKKKLLEDMQEQSKKHLQQIKNIKQILSKNEQQYKNWLDQSKKQKLELIQRYQAQIRLLQKSQFSQKMLKSDNSIQQTVKARPLLRQLQQKNIDLQQDIKKLNIQIQKYETTRKQHELKTQGLNEQLKYIKAQYMHQIGQNKKMLANLKNQEERYEKLRVKCNKIQIQIQAYKINNQQTNSQNIVLKKQVQSLKQSMTNQLKSLITIKKQLSQATNNELNINSNLTQTSLKQSKKIQQLQQQLQSITTQLYAQRLQKAKLQQQLNQTKIQLKRQYELSIQNTRRQLLQQIRNGNKGSRDVELQKQKQQIYLNMFKIQRQYELLKSQVITADQVVKMGTKMAKYYCHQSQSNKKKVR